MRKIILTSVTLLLLSFVYYFFIQKTCSLISSESLRDANVPFEERLNEKGFIYQVFEKQNGQWYVCATRFENLGHF